MIIGNAGELSDADLSQRLLVGGVGLHHMGQLTVEPLHRRGVGVDRRALTQLDNWRLCSSGRTSFIAADVSR